MTYNVISIPGQPTIQNVRDYSAVLEVFKQVARYSGKGGNVYVSGTTVTAGGAVIGYYHVLTDYNGVVALKAAAELDANGFDAHADAIRKQVAQAQTQSVCGYSSAESRAIGTQWLADIADESVDAAAESYREIARIDAAIESVARSPFYA
jgi:hypothetical protein